VANGKILIAGTGRAGTTLLVQVLGDLGLDTGFRRDASFDSHSRAGLERSLFAPNAPRIVKNPTLSRRLGSILASGEVEIDHVIVPVRALDVAVASRVRVSQYGKAHGVRGGMIGGAKRPSTQRAYLAETFYELIWTLCEFDVPYTLLAFPKFATDAEYTYQKLEWLLEGIDRAELARVLATRVDMQVIDERALSRDELRRARIGTAYALTIALPVAKLRQWTHRRHGTSNEARDERQ
jgi:hypothetical protein